MHQIKGIVVKGLGYGRKIGFPTVNLRTEGKDLPKDGVYRGTATLAGTIYRAGIVIGPEKKVEAHIIGYSGNAYGKEVNLKLDKFLREYKKFNSEDELKRQIAEDISKC
jgi:riboflavin kinase/FMN adenylyltransferase